MLASRHLANADAPGVLRKARAARPVELFIAWKRDNDNPARQNVLDTCLDYGRRSVAGSRR